MPSLPLTASFAFPFAATNLFSKSKLYLLDALNYMLSNPRANGGEQLSTVDEDVEEGAQPTIDRTLDIGVFRRRQDSDNMDVEESIRELISLLSSSVQNALPQDADSGRVLVFGRQAAFYSNWLLQAGFPATVKCLTSDDVDHTTGGIFWSDDAVLLATLPAGVFDVVLCFNLDRNASEHGVQTTDEPIKSSNVDAEGAMGRLIEQLSRVLKPGGCLAATGIFKNSHQNPMHPVENVLWEDQWPVGCGLTMQGVRGLLEAADMQAQIVADLSLDGQVVVRMDDDDTRESDLFDLLQAGHMVCARILAAKPVLMDVVAPRHQRIIQVRGPLPKRGRFRSRVCSDASLQSGLQNGLSGEMLAPHAFQMDHASLESLLQAGPELLEELSRNAHIDEAPKSRSRAHSHAKKVMAMCADVLQDGAASPDEIKETVQEVMCELLAEKEAEQEHKLLQAPLAPEPVAPKEEDYLRVGISGVSLGLPNGLHPERSVFDADNLARIFRGENFISHLTCADHQKMLDNNIHQVEKRDGKRIKRYLDKPQDLVQLCSKIGKFDLAKEYNVPEPVVEAMDITYQLAVAAGLEALRNAGVALEANHALPQPLRGETGVIFASSFPALDSCVEEVRKNVASKTRRALQVAADVPVDSQEHDYEYDRKLLFKLLVMANAQLAELIKARGPNTQMNSACSSMTQAITVAEDWIRAGRCSRVVVVSADNATSDNLLEYLGTGFLALGAATTVANLHDAATPFDSRRKGMILGAGAAAMVVESAAAARARGWQPRAELLGSHHCNSAFHASLIDNKHVAQEFGTFMQKMKQKHGLCLESMAEDTIYFSHETCTHSNGGCAKAEIDGLVGAFGLAGKERVMLANTKQFTGHPMGVGLEDVVAVAALDQGLVPPIINHQKTDPHLGRVLLSPGGSHTRRFALRFAAGFGSQFSILLYRKWQEDAQGVENC